MKFAVGYQLPDEDDGVLSIAADYREHVAEVYFALPGAASGRSVVGMAGTRVDVEAGRVMAGELRALRDLGIGLTLLINANCYGDDAISRGFAALIRRQVGDLVEDNLLGCVTTTSPFVARILKESNPDIEIRASVNMRIGTVKAMEYLADGFDGYYMQRDYNRDLARIAGLSEWCRRNGKTLHLLANSGCLHFCPFQTYHDNLVAHEKGIVRRDNVPNKYPAPCWDYIAKPQNRVRLLQNTWIRPEDIGRYEPYFDTVKLATRMHSRPRMVVDAYVRRRHRGNLLDLMEPSYVPLLPGCILDNTRFPSDWFDRTSSCGRCCDSCDYCNEVLERVLVEIPGCAETSSRRPGRSDPRGG